MPTLQLDSYLGRIEIMIIILITIIILLIMKAIHRMCSNTLHVKTEMVNH